MSPDLTTLNLEVLPEISEEELDRMKCAQREEQDRQWDQMPEEERQEFREKFFHAEGDVLEPLIVAEFA